MADPLTVRQLKTIADYVKSEAARRKESKFRKKVEEMERKYDTQFKMVFEAIKRLLEPPTKTKEPIGFHPRKKGDKSC